MSTNGFEQIATKLQDQVATGLLDIAQAVGEHHRYATRLNGDTVVLGLGMEDNAQLLRDCAKDVQQGIFKLLVMGEFKNGKSTLLNAMLGDEILPAKMAPATAVITMLVAGDAKQVLVFEKNQEQPRRYSWEEFHQNFQLTAQDKEMIDSKKPVDRFRDVKYAVIESRNRLTRHGVRVIDSPGLGEALSRTQVTTSFLRQSHAVIFVLRADKALSSYERKYIKKIAGKRVVGQGYPTNVFFVINHINVIPEDEVEEIKEFFHVFLKPFFRDENDTFNEELYQRRVYFINALGALKARQKTPNDLEKEQASGILALEQELERFLTSDQKIAAVLDSTIKSLVHVTSSAQQLIQNEKSAADEAVEVLEARRAVVEKDLKELEQDKAQLERRVLRFGDLIASKLYADLLAYVAEMEDTWPQDSKELIDLDEIGLRLIAKAVGSQSGKEQLANIVAAQLSAYLQTKISAWSERVPILIDPDMQALWKVVEAQVQAFEVKLDNITSFFATGGAKSVITKDINKKKGQKTAQALLGLVLGDFSQAGESMIGKRDWPSFVVWLVQNIIRFLYLDIFLGGFILAISFLILEIILIRRGAGQFKQRILDASGEQLFKGLREHLPKQREALGEQMRHQFQEIANKITEKLQEKINKTRANHDRLISQKKDQDFSSEAEKQRLDAINTVMQDRFDTVCEAVYGRKLSNAEIVTIATSQTGLFDETAVSEYEQNEDY